MIADPIAVRALRRTLTLLICFAALLLAVPALAAADETAPAAEPTAPVGQPAPVQALGHADPTVRVARQRRCASRTIVLTPSYTGGQLERSLLFVNGRKRAELTASGAVFSLGVRRFKRGRNNYEIVSLFTDGSVASKIGHFTRCKR